MKRFYTLSGMRTGNRPYRTGCIVIEAFTVRNSLQGRFDGNIPQGHRECTFYTVIDDKIDMARPCQSFENGPNRDIPHLNVDGSRLKGQETTNSCRPGFGIKIHDTSFLPLTSESPKVFRHA